MIAGTTRALRHALLVTCLSCAIATSAKLASAHEADDLHDHEQNYFRRIDPDKQTRRIGAFEFRFGQYRPRVDSEFDAATPYEDAYGTKQSWTFGLEGDWQAVRIPYVGSLGPGLGVHWYNRKSIAPFSVESDEESAHPDRLWIIPIYAVAVLRVDVFKQQWGVPLVPYVKGGFSMGLWEARDAKKVSTVIGADGSETKARGIETGLQFQAGLMLHLNPLVPQMALDMDASAGVNDAYLFFEWWMSDVDSFGNGMQIGTNTWSAGLAIEF